MRVLQEIVQLWEKAFLAAEKAKKRQFGDAAQRAWRHLGRNIDDGFTLESVGDLPEGMKQRRFTRVNKSAEFVALMLPYVHYKVPNRLCQPRRDKLPAELMGLVDQTMLAMSQMQGVPPEQVQTASAYHEALKQRDRIKAALMNWMVNYTPGEYGLYREARIALPEGLVKGRAVHWHGVEQGPSGFIPVSYYDSVDNLFIDPDAKQLRDAGYIIRRRERSAWRVAAEFGIDREKLRGHRNSHWGEAQQTKDDEDKDVVVYYEVWSRMGLGHHIDGANDELKKFAAGLDQLGPYIWLAIVPGMDYPLNLQPEVLTGDDVVQQIVERASWPLKLYENFADPWACSVLDFLPNSDDCWATSPLNAALPYQELLEYTYEQLVNKVAWAGRRLIVCSKELDESIRKALKSGADLQLVTAQGKVADDIRKLIEIITIPDISKDAWNMLSIIERNFERAAHMDPLLYGGQPSTQPRSAEEVRRRDEHLTNRPNDFADVVEEWMSRMSAKEAQIARMEMDADTVGRCFGETPTMDPETQQAVYGPLTQVWMQTVHTEDPKQAAAELEYTVEAGSGRRPNLQALQSDLMQVAQPLLPMFAQLANAQGIVDPFNSLMDIIDQSTEGRLPMGKLKLPSIPTPSAGGQFVGGAPPYRG